MIANWVIAGTMTQLFDVGQEECSVLFLWTYLAAALALTTWSTVFMWILTWKPPTQPRKAQKKEPSPIRFFSLVCFRYKHYYYICYPSFLFVLVMSTCVDNSGGQRASMAWTYTYIGVVSWKTEKQDREYTSQAEEKPCAVLSVSGGTRYFVCKIVLARDIHFNIII